MISAGSSLGKYRIIEQIGAGGMGAVFRAVDEQLERYVAIKVISSRIDNLRDERVARFEAEARIVARLDHPNIVPVFDFGREGELVYFVSPLISGETLDRKIQRGMLPIEEVESVLHQMALALDYAHAQGVIHRDIKPQNIIIDGQKTARLMDFGIAKVPDDSSQTITGYLVGTPVYMAPEMFTRSAIDGRVDLYALGLVVFEMLTARKPFSDGLAGTDFSRIIYRIVQGESWRLNALRPDLPGHLVEAVHRAFAVEPGVRFATAVEFFDAAFPTMERQAPKPRPAAGASAQPEGFFGRVREWLGIDTPPKQPGEEEKPVLVQPPGSPLAPASPRQDSATQFGEPSEYTRIVQGTVPPFQSVTPQWPPPAKTPPTPFVEHRGSDPGSATQSFPAQLVPGPPKPVFPSKASAPPTQQHPPSEPGEFTRMFQNPVAPPAPKPAAPSKASPLLAQQQPASEPGEFTRMFQSPVVPPPPKPAAPSKASPPPVQQQPASEPGEFTRMFQNPVALPTTKPAAPSKASPPPAQQLPSEPGEFTRIFQSAVVPPPPKPAAPSKASPPPAQQPASTVAAALPADEARSDPRPASESAPTQTPPPSAVITPSPLSPEPATISDSKPTEPASAPLPPAPAFANTAPAAEPVIAQGAPESGPTASQNISPPMPAYTNDATLMFSTRPNPQALSPSQQPQQLAGEMTRMFAVPPSIGDVAAKAALAPADVALSISSCADPVFVGRRTIISRTPFRIGRNASESDFVLSFDPAVSNMHAEIDSTEQGWVIRDLDSANGTFVNGKRLVPHRDETLIFGVKILLGSNTEIVFVTDDLEEIPDLKDREIANGRYILRKNLHSSTKSAVYTAYDTHLQCEVAIKLLSPRLAGYRVYREEFKREAATLNRLQHSNICPVRDFGETVLGDGPSSNSLYVATKHLEGGSLAGRLPVADLDLSVAATWLEKICDALDYLEAHQIVHGAIKPSAIVFDLRDIPYLTDFAFATTHGEGGTRGVSTGFLAPEQWEGEPLSSAADQYSLAVLFYLLLTGSLPFEGQDHWAKRATNFRRGPVSAHEKAVQNNGRVIPARISMVLNRALMQNPADRFATAGEFAKAFRVALQPPEQPAEAVATAPERPFLFISYHRLSSPYLPILLQQELEREGFEVFLDTQQRDTVGRFPRKIERAIDRCNVFICLLGAATLQSKWVNREIQHAIAKDKELLPVFQETFVPPEDSEDLPAHVRQLLDSDAVRIIDTQSYYMKAGLTWLKDSIRQLLDN